MNGMSAKVNTHRISVEILRSLFDDRVSLIPVMHAQKEWLKSGQISLMVVTLPHI